MDTIQLQEFVQQRGIVETLQLPEFVQQDRCIVDTIKPQEFLPSSRGGDWHPRRVPGGGQGVDNDGVPELRP